MQYQCVVNFYQSRTFSHRSRKISMYLFFLSLHCILQFSLRTNRYMVWVVQVCEHTWTFCAILFLFVGFFVLWIYISKTQIMKYSDHEDLACWLWKRICSLVPIHIVLVYAEADFPRWKLPLCSTSWGVFL